jgi:hypothetical protein
MMQMRWVSCLPDTDVLFVNGYFLQFRTDTDEQWNTVYIEKVKS